MRSVITYLRYSSAIQGAEGADSTRRQNDLFKQWLKKNSDAQVVASFSDEGLSGYKGKHLTGQFGDMLARIESGEFPEGTILLVESIDRIGRLELKWSTKTGHRVRVFSSIDFPIRLVVTHHYIRAVLVRCNIQRYSPLLRELHR